MDATLAIKYIKMRYLQDCLSTSSAKGGSKYFQQSPTHHQQTQILSNPFASAGDPKAHTGQHHVQHQHPTLTDFLGKMMSFPPPPAAAASQPVSQPASQQAAATAAAMYSSYYHHHAAAAAGYGHHAAAAAAAAHPYGGVMEKAAAAAAHQGQV